MVVARSVLQGEAFFEEETRGMRISPLVIVCCYNGFDDLAHQPRGTMATKYSLMVYKVDLDSGRMTCASVLAPTVTAELIAGYISGGAKSSVH